MQKLYPFFLIIASFIIFMIYWPGLSGPLILDDWPQLMPIINGINNDNWASNYKQFILSNSGILNRPVSMISFIFNAATSGNDLWYWKTTNVLLHILCGLSIFFTTRSLLSFDSRNNKKHITYLSSIISLIWLLHPLHVSTVLYLVQRMTILSAFFTISALACYLHGFNKELNNRSGLISLLSSALLLFPLALFSKENAALYPIYILLMTLYIIRSNKLTIIQLPKRIKTYNSLMILLVFTGLIALLYYRDILILNGYNTREFTIYERLLTESRVVIYYMAQIIIPLPSSMGFFHDDFIISKNLLHPLTTLTSIASIIFLIYISFSKSNKYPTLGFGLLFFFTSHLFESTIFPLEIAFEHRNYIGMWGIILALSNFLTIIKFNKYIFITIFLTLSSLTLYRSSIWNNLNKMYPHMLMIHPHSKRLNVIHAETYTSAKKYDTALKYLYDLNGIGYDLQRLYIKCHKDNKLSAGVFHDLINNNKNIKIGTYEMEGIITMANLGLDNKCLFSKIEFVDFLSTITKSAKLKNIDLQKIHIYEGHYHHELGNNDLSIIALERSFLAYMKNPIPLFLMVEYHVEKNQLKRARAKFGQAKIISDTSFYDYSEFITRISPMISSNNLN